MANKKWFNGIGTINLGKRKLDGTPGKLYVNLRNKKNEDGTFNTEGLNELARRLQDAGERGVNIQIEKPQTRLRRMANLGYIDDLEVQLERYADEENGVKGPLSFIKYELTLGPESD